MYMYAIGMMPLVDKAEQAGTIQSWFADDSAAASVLRRLRRSWDILASDGPAYGYFPNASKSILVVKERCYREAVELFSDTSVVITCNGARYLGAAIGSANFKENFVSTKVQEWADEQTRLADFARSQPQAAYYAYVSGLRSRWAFLCRVQSISPSQFQPLEDVISTKLIPAMTGRPPPGTVLREVLTRNALSFGWPGPGQPDDFVRPV